MKDVRYDAETVRSALFRLVTAVLLAGLLIFAGCTDSSSSDIATNADSGPVVTGEVGVAGAPKPVDGEPTGPVAVDGPTTTQTFQITAEDSEEAVKSYQEVARSAGWTTASDPVSSGSTDWTMTMVKGSATLLVTASPANGVSEFGSDVVEISIEVTT